MRSATTKDVVSVLTLAVLLVVAMVGLFFWNQRSQILDPLATQVYTFFVSR